MEEGGTSGGFQMATHQAVPRDGVELTTQLRHPLSL
jgi:hypothetical protein